MSGVKVTEAEIESFLKNPLESRIKMTRLQYAGLAWALNEVGLKMARKMPVRDIKAMRDLVQASSVAFEKAYPDHLNDSKQEKGKDLILFYLEKGEIGKAMAQGLIIGKVKEGRKRGNKGRKAEKAEPIDITPSPSKLTPLPLTPLASPSTIPLQPDRT